MSTSTSYRRSIPAAARKPRSSSSSAPTAAGGEALDAADADRRGALHPARRPPARDRARGRSRAARPPRPRRSSGSTATSTSCRVPAGAAPIATTRCAPTIAWSYELLDAPGTRVVRPALGLRGFVRPRRRGERRGHRRHAADVADRLHDLVSKSMVDLRSGRDGEPPLPVADQPPRLRGRAAPYAPRTSPTRSARTRDHYLDRLAGHPAMAEHRARPVGRARTRARRPAARDRPRLEQRPNPSCASAAARATEPLAFVLTNLGLFDDARRRCDAALDDRARACEPGPAARRGAYLEASEDGISDYVSFAGEALQYLQPGDGVWSAAVGDDVDRRADVRARSARPPNSRRRSANSTATRRPAPNRTVRRCSSTWRRPDELRRLRRDAGRCSSARPRSCAALEPTSIIRLWAAAAAAMSLTMLGAARTHARTCSTSVAVARRLDRLERRLVLRRGVRRRRTPARSTSRTTTLRSIGIRFDNVDVSPMASTVIAGFGVVAHLRGDDDTSPRPVRAARRDAHAAIDRRAVRDDRGNGTLAGRTILRPTLGTPDQRLCPQRRSGRDRSSSCTSGDCSARNSQQHEDTRSGRQVRGRGRRDPARVGRVVPRRADGGQPALGRRRGQRPDRESPAAVDGLPRRAHRRAPAPRRLAGRRDGARMVPRVGGRRRRRPRRWRRQPRPHEPAAATTRARRCRARHRHRRARRGRRARRR